MIKVISIKQPWASLIVEGYKKYEFRTWKTNYRGKCLIHSSKTVDQKMMEKVKHLNLTFPLGVILGEVVISDCLKVTKEFENNLIKENKLIYGQSTNRDGYAFYLTDIKKYKKLIPVRGKLGLWNYEKEKI